MKLRFIIFWVLVAILLFVGCNKSRNTVVRQCEILEVYADSLAKASSANDVVAAMNTFITAYEALLPDLEILHEKYPELKTIGGEMPKDFKDLESRLQAVGQKFSDSSQKIMPFLSDPEVLEASKRFYEFMQKANK